MICELERRRMLSAALSDGRLVVSGTDGNDVIVLAVAGKTVSVTVNGVVSKFALARVRSASVTGLAGNDRLDARGVAFNTTLNGGLGSDKLFGGRGNDRLHGGRENGDPVVNTGWASDVLSGGPGIDTADYTGRREGLMLSIGSGTTFADGVQQSQSTDGIPLPGTGEFDNIRDDVENVVGGSGDDFIAGNARANRLSGGPGFDQFSGESDDGVSAGDVFGGGPGRDLVSYKFRARGVVISRDGKANDGSKDERDRILNDVEIIEGSRGNDSVLGGPGNDHLLGEDGRDTLLGFGGNDTLAGGRGRDVMRGGDGGDLLAGTESLDSVIFPELNLDTVFGEGGNDRAEVDLNDVVNDAEVIERIDPVEPMPEEGPNPEA